MALRSVLSVFGGETKKELNISLVADMPLLGDTLVIRVESQDGVGNSAAEEWVFSLVEDQLPQVSIRTPSDGVRLMKVTQC